MANEIVQWIAILTLGLLVLGAFRQISLMLPAEDRAIPSGPPVGKRLPGDVVRRLSLETLAAEDGAAIVAFVSESCAGCQSLLTTLGETAPRNMVLVAKDPSPHFRAALDELPVPVVTDAGAIWEACGVTSTPLLVRTDGRGRVAAKEVTHHVDALASTSA